MDKFKVGDKVRRTSEFREQFYAEAIFTVESVYNGRISLEDIIGNWDSNNFELAIEWTIYNNTKPLCELTDEQAGKMIKHGGEIEHMNPYNKEWGVVKIPSWAKSCVYRAKQKSERELFIEAVNKALSNEALMAEPYADILFEAGFKAPEAK